MLPRTEAVPKTLLTVAGRPFAEWQLDWLAGAGFTDVVYSIGHLGHLISETLGDGDRWGLRISYVDEGQELRGTAGALRLAADRGVLAESFCVVNGDSYLQVDPAEVLSAFRSRPEPALMTVYRNAGRWDGSNVILDGDRVGCYRKGLADPPAAMQWIDYGLLAFDASLILERVPATGRADLAPLCTDLSAEGRLAAFRVAERFYEIGSPLGLADLERHLCATPPAGA